MKNPAEAFLHSGVFHICADTGIKSLLTRNKRVKNILKNLSFGIVIFYAVVYNPGTKYYMTQSHRTETIMFGEKVKELRTGMGWTQQELGNRLQVSKQSVSNWENGNIMPSIELLVRISDLFQVTTDYILDRADNLSLDITDLDSSQKDIVSRMVAYFRSTNPKKQKGTTD